MCVSTINGEINNHMIQEKEPTKNEAIFGMDDSAVILDNRELSRLAGIPKFCVLHFNFLVGLRPSGRARQYGAYYNHLLHLLVYISALLSGLPHLNSQYFL